MNFKFGNLTSAIALTLTTVVGCAPASNKASERFLEFKTENDGCLNDMGPELEAYLDGKSSSAKWESVWDCAEANLKMFLEFAEGSVAGGYSVDDVHALISQLMVTNQPVRIELVRAHFRLKAAVFGGSAEVLTKVELQSFLELLKIVRTHSLGLIPHLRNRAFNPSPENLDQLANALQDFLVQVADHLESKVTSVNPLYTWGDIDEALVEFATLQGWTIPADVSEKIRFGKGLLVAGSAQGIEPLAWSKVLRQVGAYARPLILLAHSRLDQMTGPNEKMEFFVKLARALQVPLQTTLSSHGGKLNLKWIDRALTFIPETATTTPRGRVIDRTVLRSALRLALVRFLKVSDPNYLDSATVEKLVNWFSTWSRQQRLLETVFVEFRIPRTGYTKDAMLTVVENLKERITSAAGPEANADIEALNEIIYILNHFRPTFVGDDEVMSFVPIAHYSLGNLTKITLNRFLSQLLLTSYASAENDFRATQEDANALLTELGPLLGELQTIDPTAPDIAAKRFKEGTLFTYDSDGDNLLSRDELTYYMMGIGSIGIHSRRTMAVLTEICALPDSDPRAGNDHYGWKWMDIECFRREYFARYREFWAFAPQLVRYWETTTDEQRQQFARSIEIAGRRFQESNDPISTFDVEGYSGVAHYVETLFQRFDTDYSQIINLSEIMGAFPVFRLELATYGKIDYSDRSKLEAVFTYTVRNGRPPDPKTASGIASFLGWTINRSFWVINADRLALYKVLAVLSTPAE